jgi:type I site-specific restriction endonuclease
MPSPEELARENIDKLLTECGWIIQNRSTINLSAGRGIAIREGLLKGGEADYLLFGDGQALGTVEAKPEGHTLIGVEEQSDKYGKGLLVQTQKVVRSAVETVLDAQLPSSYDRVLFRKKIDNVLEMMLDYASHGLKWAA